MFDVAQVFYCPKVAGIQKDGLLQKLLRPAELIATGTTDALSDNWSWLTWFLPGTTERSIFQVK